MKNNTKGVYLQDLSAFGLVPNSLKAPADFAAE